MIDMFIPSD